MGVSSQLAARFSDIVPHRTYETNGLVSSSDNLLQCICRTVHGNARLLSFPRFFTCVQQQWSIFPRMEAVPLLPGLGR